MGTSVFKYTKGGFILHEYLCYGYIDCSNDSSDEKLCNCDKYPSDSTNCKYVFGKNAIRFCPSLYYLTSKSDCNKYTLRGHKLKTESKPVPLISESLICNHNEVISTLLLNDLVADCGPEGEDEYELKSLLRYESHFSCKQSQEIPCLRGHPKCFNLTDICIYKINKNHQMVPCRNGGHLQRCKQFECNQMFKCVGSYCMPWNYVCDGKWDSPEGDDERGNAVCGNDLRCLHMYKCRNTNFMCLHIGNVCNGYINCPFEDDEMSCDLKSVKCPLVCQCLLNAITCQYLSGANIKTLNVTIYYYTSCGS